MYKFLIFFLLLASCVHAPDVPVCVEITPERARCVKIISGTESTIDETNLYNGFTWWEARPTMVQVPAESWAQIKAFIIKVCKKSNQCDSQISSWERSIQAIDSSLQSKQ